MKPHPSIPARRRNPGKPGKLTRRDQGAALMMTLIMLVLLSILVTGFVVSMRTELSVSYANENIQRTKMVSQAAVSHGIELLRANIPEPASITARPDSSTDAPPRNWISNPGRLVVDIGTGDQEVVDLHTGTMHDGDDLTSFDLNAPLAGETAAAIVEVETGERPKMRVAWHNILEDPSVQAGIPLEDGDTNAIIGRYAFWMDDESSKINFNTASGKRDNAWEWLIDEWLAPYTQVPRGFGGGNEVQSFTLGHPLSVNLNHLFDEQSISPTGNRFDRGKLRTHVYTHGWHQYPEAIMEYYDFDSDPEVISEEEREWYDENKWNITFYSRSPEFNVFGKSRFFTIFNPLALEGGPAYQMPFAHNNVLHLHTLMGGLEHSVNEAAVNEANLDFLRQYLTRDDWPGYEGTSFETKFGGPESAYQVALNFIQMGILASGDVSEGNKNPDQGEHLFALNMARDIVDGTRNDPSNTTRWPERELWEDDDGNLYLPQTPGPHLTQVHFKFFTEAAPDHPSGDKQAYIGFRYQVEYFMHNHGWVVPTMRGFLDDGSGNPTPTDSGGNAVNSEITPFPTAIDFLKLDAVVTDAPTQRRVNGVRSFFNALKSVNWQTVSHRELMMDIAHKSNTPGTPSKQTFALAPVFPERPGLPGYVKNKNIRTSAWSPKFYVSMRTGGGANGGWGGRPDGHLPELATIEKETNGDYRGRFNFERAKFRVSRARVLGQTQTIGEDVTIDFKIRLGLAGPGANNANQPSGSTEIGLNLGVFNRPKQLVPLGNTPTAPSTGGLAEPLEPDPDHVLEHSITFSDIRFPSEQEFGWECNVDPRIARKLSDWDMYTGSNPSFDDVGFDYARSAQTKFRHLQFGWSPSGAEGNKHRIKRNRSKLGLQHIRRGSRALAETYRFTSQGYYSLIHTGQQVGEEHRTLSLLPKDKEDSFYNYASGPPDYVLFDLFAPSFCMDSQQWRNDHRLPDSWNTVSYMNSTAGQINLNSKIYPDDSAEFNPPERIKPLEAVFVHLRNTPASWAEDFAQEIVDYQEDVQPFAYVGELAEVDGYLPNGTSSRFRQEEILRNMMPCLTTKSNTFGLWGVAQTVRKSPSNLESTPDRYADGDQILGEKRFFALIERYVWPGRDGAPGNAHVGPDGKWDRLAEPRQKSEGEMASDQFANEIHDTPGSPPNVNPQSGSAGSSKKFAPMDGPDVVNMVSNLATGGDMTRALADVTHTQSSLEEAYNPPHPVIKYRVVYFKYLDQ